MRKLSYISLILLLFTACSPKEVNFEELVFVIQSDPMHLKEHKAANSSVYVLVRQGENNIKDMQAAVEQNLRQNSYTIATNPSNAGYIIHISVPSMGAFSDASLKDAANAGYGEPIKQISHTLNDDEQKLAIVADVLIVARIVPAEVRRRPAVVSTTSKPSKVAESSARILVAIPDDDDYTITEARPHLVQRVAKSIVSSLP